MTILTMITLVGSLVFTTSCKKNKDEDPTPTTNPSGNTAPEITSADYSGGVITVVATDNGSVVKVEFINDGSVITEDNSAPFEFNTSILGTGTYPNFKVKATDNLGATTTYNVPTFTVTGNPTPSVIASYSNGEITISATDDGSVASVQVLNGTTVLTTLTTSPYIYSVGTLSAGTYNYTVRATDNVGGTSTTTVTFTIVNQSPIFNTTIYTGKTFTLSVSDPENNPITVTSVTSTTVGVTASNNGTAVTITTPTNFAGNVTLNVIISDGTNTVPTTVSTSVGTIDQGATYDIIKGSIGTGKSVRDPSTPRFTLTLNANGTFTASVSNTYTQNFLGASCTSGTWTINSSGILEIIDDCTGGSPVTYTVTTPGAPVIELNGSYNWRIY